MVYRLIVSYLGSPFAGWQRQPDADTVQQHLEEAVESIVGRACPVTGAGRTDAGVHARGQVAHLRLDRPFERRALVRGVNHFLPGSIRVLAAARVRQGFDARKSALAKEYRYRLTRTPIPTPLEAPFEVVVDPEIDLDRLRRATAAVVGEHDFTAFALAGGSHDDPRRRVLAASWRESGPVVELSIVGEGFLRGMVRSLVGTLVEVGTHRREVEAFGRLLEGAPRSDAGPTAPAHGLVLEQVYYAPGWETVEKTEETG
ncbi:MAG: tRNA pseudouridine(38-40) synthase TruA [Thermoanaerobaculia bacterium]|nr:tRNA pseudouridine(38-40) synthase TruA [Thermoanaerobaculia bacterium]